MTSARKRDNRENSGWSVSAETVAAAVVRPKCGLRCPRPDRHCPIPGGLGLSHVRKVPVAGNGPSLSVAPSTHAWVTTNLPEQLRYDATALQHYDNLGLELPTGLLSAMGPRLLQPSLTLLGYEDGIGTLASTRVVERLAHEGLTQGLRVSVISGRDWSADLRAACLVGRPAARQIASKRPRPDDPDLDAREYLGGLAEAGGRLSVLAVEELRRGDRPRTPVDLVLIDDVHGVDRLWGASDGGGDHNLPDASPQGLRHASRLMMCSIVVTVDWRLTERWRWTREADVVVDIELDEGLPVIRHGNDVERLPI